MFPSESRLILVFLLIGQKNWGEFLKQSCIVVMQNQLLHDTQVKPLGKHYYYTCNSSISGFGAIHESVVELQVTNDEPALRQSGGTEAFKVAP